MNLTQQLAGGVILALVAHVTPESAVTPSIPARTDAAFAAICKTSSVDRPDPDWMRQSFEGDHCSLPQEPQALDGTKASRDELIAGLAAAKKFAVAAERYQECINAYLTQRKHESERSGQPVKLTLVAIETHRI